MSGPAWGYTADGRGRVFDDGVLPPGWHPTPPLDLPADEWTRRHEAEVRAITPAQTPAWPAEAPAVRHELGGMVDAPPAITTEVMAEAKAVVEELAPRKRGRPRKVA